MQLWLEVFGVLTCICAIQAQNSSGRNQYVRENVDIFPPLPLGVIDGKNVLCRDQTRLYIDHLRNMSLWAYEIRDSTAKSANGLLRGGIAQFGQFEECLSVNAPFATQYCVATIVANVPVPNPPRDPKSLIYNPNESVLRKIYDKNDPAQQAENVALLGWCVPASCTAEDLQEYLNEYLSTVDSQLRTENVSYIASIGSNACQAQNDNRTLDQIDISFLLVTLIILLLLIASTICDIMWTDEGKLGGDSPTRRLLVSFSIKKNYPKLSKSEDSNPALRVLYGMRVICICMIITDHRFGTFLSNAIMNFNEVEEQYRSTFGTLFFHGDLFVDSFFILSGILVTYCLLVQFEKRILNPGFIILMRYIRLTPMYAYVIYFCATIFYFVGHGPMWKTIIAPEVQDCRDNWWTSVLYISNYVNAEHMCMVHSWYLPCDFHYFIVAIFLCILINKRKKAGLIALAVLFVVSILIPFIIVFVNNRPAVLFFYLDFIRSPKSHPDFLLTYVKSHARSTPYFVGIVAGYLFYRSRNQKVRLNWVLSYTIFSISIVLMLVSILTGVIFYDPYYEYDTLDAAAYSSLHRTVWSIGSVGVLYVASHGTIKWVYNALSWGPWVPLSKLVYGAYLVHFQIALRATAKKAGADVTSYFDIISYALSDIVLSFASAFFLYLVIEAPFRNIFGLLFVPSKEAKEKNNNEKSEDVNETTDDSHL